MRCTPVVAGLAMAALVAPGLPVSAALPAAPRPVVSQVTGVRAPLSAYAARGLAPVAAARVLWLDALARQGIPVSALQAADRALASDDSASSGGSTQDPVVFLSAVGDLDRRGGADVLEQRLDFGKTSATTTLVARDGRSGRVLWRTARRENNGTVFATAARVGSGGRPGVLLLGGGFDPDGIRTTLSALDGAGRQLWTRTVRTPFPSLSGGAIVGSSSSGAYVGVATLADEGLRRGPLDEVVLTESYNQGESNGVSSGQHGEAAAYAVSSGNGALRGLPGRVSTDSGAASVTVLPDQDGDGFDDLGTVDGGTAQTVTVLRADGTVVWRRSDVPTHGYGFLVEVGRLTGATVKGRRVQDLSLTTAPAPGAVGAVSTPTGDVADPTAAAHGSVLLLAGGTGATVWTKPGDAPYPVLRAGVPALGVVTTEDTSTASTRSIRVGVEAFDAAGSSRWTRSVSASVPQDPSGNGFSFAFGGAQPVTDLDADGGLEGVVYAVAVSDTKDDVQDQLIASASGTPLKDQKSGLLFGSVTRRGSDRVTVAKGRAGLVVTVRRGTDGATLLHRLVPGSQGVARGNAQAGRLGTAVCSDVLVGGYGGGHAVAAVLASNGQPRWSVSRVAGDTGNGRLVTPVAPRPRC